MPAVSECERSGAMLVALKHQQRKGQSWKWGRMMRRNGVLGQAPLNSSIKRRACHSQWTHVSSAEYVMEISALGGAALPVRFSCHWLYCPLRKHDTISKRHCVLVAWDQLSVLVFPAFLIVSLRIGLLPLSWLLPEFSMLFQECISRFLTVSHADTQATLHF